MVGNRVLAPELAREVEPELVQEGAGLGLAQGVAEPERGLVVAEPELVPVEAVPELNQVVVELELVPVVAVPELGHPRGRLAVAPRTKSVTAARRRDLARLLAGEEDLAAVAEIMHAQAAAEAATAWAAAE